MCKIFIPREIEEEYYDILNIPKSKSICELGGALVLPEYRKKEIMTNLSIITMDYFNNLNFDYIISTAHSENIPSNKIVRKLGFELYVTLTTQSGYVHCLYWKKAK